MARPARGDPPEQCHCTNEIFLWPSFTYPPLQLGRALLNSKAWKKSGPLQFGEREQINIDTETRLPVSNDKSVFPPIEIESKQ